LFGRFTRALTGAIGDSLPPGGADLRRPPGSLETLAATSRLRCQFLPDLKAGRHPWMRRWRISPPKPAKKLGAETVDEQIASSTPSAREQVRMLASASMGWTRPGLQDEQPAADGRVGLDFNLTRSPRNSTRRMPMIQCSAEADARHR
jgi:hypothetical protein